MSSKIEVPRELLEALVYLHGTDQYLDIDMAKISALLATPVVERQPLPIYQVRYLGDGGAGWSDIEKHELDPLKSRKDYHTRTVFDAPPELAELQATIARLTAENERLKILCSDAAYYLSPAIVSHQFGMTDETRKDALRVCSEINLLDKSTKVIERLRGVHPAPVSSVPAEIFQLLQRATVYARGEFLAEINACLDRVKELNQ